MEQRTSSARSVSVAQLDSLHLASEAPPEAGLMIRHSQDNPEAFATLQASLAAVGVLLPLLVTDLGSRTYVIAGNRRLRALRGLSEQGRIAADYVVPITRIDGSDSEEVSVAEIALMANIALPLHPVDRYEVLAAVVDGHDASSVGERWGLTDLQVKQTLALGRLAPAVRDAWRAGRVNRSAAEAFTLEPDFREQEKLLTELLKNSNTVWDSRVRTAIMGDARDVGRHVLFVGAEAYEAAGGLVNRDLFGTDHRVSDRKLLMRMVDEKIAERCNSLIAAGWSFAAVRPTNYYSYQRMPPAKRMPTPEQRDELKRLEMLSGGNDDEDNEGELSEAIDALKDAIALNSYSPAERAKSGVFVYVAEDGALHLDGAMVAPKTARAEQVEKRKLSAKQKAMEQGEPSGKPASAVLESKLAQWLTEAAASTLLGEKRASPYTKVALAAVAAGIRSGGEICEIKLVRDTNKPQALTETFAEAFRTAMKQTMSELYNDIAVLAAAALRLETSGEGSAVLCCALNEKLFRDQLVTRFDRETYFASRPKTANLAALAEMGMKEDAIAAVAKAPAAKVAALCLNEALDSKWLPPQLRCARPAAESRKAKPAPAKGGRKRK
jgi:ParB family transcriptional regulator, chromosome partitioning protein